MLAELEKLFAQSDQSNVLFPWKEKSWNRFCEMGLPTKKCEAYRYFPMRALNEVSFGEKEESSGDVQGNRIVFVDGKLVQELSEGIVVSSLEESWSKYGVLLQSRWKKHLRDEQDPFVFINRSLFEKGAFVYVPPGVEESISVIHIARGGIVFPHMQLFLGKGAKCTIDVQRIGIPALNNEVIDVVLENDARLKINDIGKDERRWDFRAVRAEVKKDAKFEMCTTSYGGDAVRTDAVVDLLEERSFVDLKGLHFLRGKAQAHVHIRVNHLAPDTVSNQLFNHVLNDRSRASFEGKIYVDSVAQKTEGYQMNKNLLLGENAIAYTRPNLEIFADDVKASHGATLAHLNEELLFYLLSRGIGKEEGKKLMIDGFCREIYAH